MSFLSEQDVQNLIINRMIFHVVGKNLQVPTLLKEIKPVQHVDFFLERIKSSLKGNLFSFIDKSNTERILRIIQTQADTVANCFTDQSKQLASDFQSHHSSGNTSMGCFFLFELISNQEKLYAIIKYDNEDVVRYVLNEKVTVEQMPTLERFHETFVKKAEAMQKIAFIKLDKSGTGGKVIVKDRSKRTNISGYFKDFLSVKRVNSEIDLCNKLIEALKATFKKHKELLPESIQKSGVNKIFEVLSRADYEYNADDSAPLLTSIFGPLEEKSPILTTFQTQTKNIGIEGESFTIKAVNIQKPARRKIETAESVVISYNEDDRPQIKQLNDGRTQIIVTTARIVIDDIDTSKNR